MWSFCIQSTFCYYGSHLGSHFRITFSLHNFHPLSLHHVDPFTLLSIIFLFPCSYFVQCISYKNPYNQIHCKYIYNSLLLLDSKEYWYPWQLTSRKGSQKFTSIWYCSKHTCTNRNIIVVHASYGYSLMLSSFL